MSQKEIGLNPIIVSSPFQNGECASNPELINKIAHYRTYNNKPKHLVTESKSSLITRINKFSSIFSFYRKVNSIVKEEKPNILHAHATFFCGIVAILLGRKHKIPIVYEVRSLWEEREKKNAKSIIAKIQPILITALETFVMRHSNLVIAINQNLKNNLQKRGKVTVKIVPNAVNTNLINTDKNPKRNKQISFGYIGSVSSIEGLNLVAKVWSELEKKGYENHFHVFGNGNYTNALQKLVISLELNKFHLHGTVKPSEVSKAFEMIDVVVNPRLKSKISDTVTPLKPLEAMAYSKLVIASDVGGMKELIEHDKTGLLFESGGVNKLEECISKVIKSGIPEHIVTQAKYYTLKNKSWLSNAQKYKTYYEGLIIR
tara:strand:- start:590 stop:1708 length:1119 start_codon:yes stop_codon:yes gene_type:complete